MIISATQTAEQQEQPEPRRFVLCETYAGGCGKGFTVPLSKHRPGGDHLCEDCVIKRDKLALLRTQLVFARKFGHTDDGCELCAVENQIDDLLTGGYDWRDEYERRIGHKFE